MITRSLGLALSLCMLTFVGCGKLKSFLELPEKVEKLQLELTKQQLENESEKFLRTESIASDSHRSRLLYGKLGRFQLRMGTINGPVKGAMLLDSKTGALWKMVQRENGEQVLTEVLVSSREQIFRPRTKEEVAQNIPGFLGGNLILEPRGVVVRLPGTDLEQESQDWKMEQLRINEAAKLKEKKTK